MIKQGVFVHVCSYCVFILNLIILALGWASHHYILIAHMNKRTLLNNIMVRKNYRHMCPESQCI